MDITKYEAFLYAADLGSFSAAAEKLSYTPAGISHMVENIEQSLDITLFNRHSSGVSLTENGRELLPHIRAIVRDEQLLKNSWPHRILPLWLFQTMLLVLHIQKDKAE